MDKSSLEALIRWLEIGSAIFGVVVVVGVAGESYFGIRLLWNNWKLQRIQAREIEGLRNETANLIHENLTLEKAIIPRRLGLMSFDRKEVTEGLDQFAGASVRIQSIPEFEAQRLASALAVVLGHFKWKPQYDDLSRTEANNLPDGVLILTAGRGPLNESAAENRVWAAGDALKRYMDRFGIESQHRPITSPNGEWRTPLEVRYPVESVVVLIGTKPTPDLESLRMLEKHEAP